MLKLKQSDILFVSKKRPGKTPLSTGNKLEYRTEHVLVLAGEKSSHSSQPVSNLYPHLRRGLSKERQCELAVREADQE